MIPADWVPLIPFGALLFGAVYGIFRPPARRKNAGSGRRPEVVDPQPERSAETPEPEVRRYGRQPGERRPSAGRTTLD